MRRYIREHKTFFQIAVVAIIVGAMVSVGVTLFAPDDVDNDKQHRTRAGKSENGGEHTNPEVNDSDSGRSNEHATTNGHSSKRTELVLGSLSRHTAMLAAELRHGQGTRRATSKSLFSQETSVKLDLEAGYAHPLEPGVVLLFGARGHCSIHRLVDGTMSYVRESPRFVVDCYSRRSGEGYELYLLTSKGRLWHATLSMATLDVSGTRSTSMHVNEVTGSDGAPLAAKFVSIVDTPISATAKAQSSSSIGVLLVEDGDNSWLAAVSESSVTKRMQLPNSIARTLIVRGNSIRSDVAKFVLAQSSKDFDVLAISTGRHLEYWVEDAVSPDSRMRLIARVKNRTSHALLLVDQGSASNLQLCAVRMGKDGVLSVRAIPSPSADAIADATAARRTSISFKLQSNGTGGPTLSTTLANGDLAWVSSADVAQASQLASLEVRLIDSSKVPSADRDDLISRRYTLTSSHCVYLFDDHFIPIELSTLTPPLWHSREDRFRGDSWLKRYEQTILGVVDGRFLFTVSLAEDDANFALLKSTSLDEIVDAVVVPKRGIISLTYSRSTSSWAVQSRRIDSDEWKELARAPGRPKSLLVDWPYVGVLGEKSYVFDVNRGLLGGSASDAEISVDASVRAPRSKTLVHRTDGSASGLALAHLKDREIRCIQVDMDSSHDWHLPSQAYVTDTAYLVVLDNRLAIVDFETSTGKQLGKFGTLRGSSGVRPYTSIFYGERGWSIAKGEELAPEDKGLSLATFQENRIRLLSQQVGSSNSLEASVILPLKTNSLSAMTVIPEITQAVAILESGTVELLTWKR